MHDLPQPKQIFCPESCQYQGGPIRQHGRQASPAAKSAMLKLLRRPSRSAHNGTEQNTHNMLSCLRRSVPISPKS